MEDFELTLFDRLEMIRSVLQDISPDECYISFSGGKDSTVLHYLIDEAIPNNEYERVFCDTGIEYNDIRNFVNEFVEKDKRFRIIRPNENIKKFLESDGYPFKSKRHAKMVRSYQHSIQDGRPVYPYVQKYIDPENESHFRCPKSLRYQFSEDFELRVSHKCCDKLKKQPFHKYEKETGRTLRITGVRKEEGGLRAIHLSGGCVFKDKNGKIYQFTPLGPVSDEFVDWYIETRNIQLAKLYYPPFNFDRTGCKGCGFNRHLDKELMILEENLPNENRQCWAIWRPLYEEYQRIHYRGLHKIKDPFKNERDEE